MPPGSFVMFPDCLRGFLWAQFRELTCAFPERVRKATSDQDADLVR